MKIIQVKNKITGSQKALDILKDLVDKDTLLLLSGGSSPDVLYELISKEQVLKPGAICLIDERYGFSLHNNSNEKMIKDTNLIAYINKEGIPFFGILKKDISLKETTSEYEKVITNLFKKFPRRVAVMGIGEDGHTAGIKPNLEYDHNRLVSGYEDKGIFGKRITLTFKALSQIERFIVLVFGQNKSKALREMLKSDNQKQIPAAFYSKVHDKVNIITDININID